MLKEVNWSEDRSYRTGSESEPIQFYMEGLCNSKQLDLLLGYFSSAAINVLSLGFASFLYQGGAVRMVVNNVLSQADKDAIKAGREGNLENTPFELSDIKKLKATLSEYGKHFFDCLAWLIANDKIQIKIIKPKEGKGIAHYKSGAFSDGTDTVGFKASCNFTAYGLLENLEELDSFLSWENSRSSKMIKRQNRDFENIFSGNSEIVDYLEVEAICIAIKKEFGNSSINELLIRESELIDRKSRVLKNEGVLKSFERAVNQIEAIIREPKFPYPEGPRKYQSLAYEKWLKNGYKGIFAMATGTGKTITSLNCILQEYKRTKFYKFLVLVPTISLSNQWEREITQKFNFQELTICSGLNNQWEDEIRGYGRNLRLGNDLDFCILTTYATFRGKRFQKLFEEMFKGHMSEITIIADEAHTLGSKNLLKVLPNLIEKRIGLSATPERQYDEEGEDELFRYFDSFAPNFTFKYNMMEAIDNRVLCRYFYFPILVELTQEELIAYKEISNKLSKFLDPITGKYKDDPYVNNLLIRRKNIIHKAKNKARCLINIIDDIGKVNFKYAFIYVPEGYEQNFEEEDNREENDDDDRIIQEYTDLLYQRYNFKLRKFTGDTNDRDQILTQFSEGKLDALLAMKCLDEGVDVPQTQYAIFCSSTGNPRQYIQRRGRVLRYHKDKEFAYIYDMIVKPAIELTDTNLKQAKLERNIFAGELKRLINFAVLSENKDDCLNQMEELCYNFDIDVYDLANKELEKYNN
jgi:superfamily II DNA or RNA helicase